MDIHRVEHPRSPRKGRTKGKGQGDHRVAIDPHKGGRVTVLGEGSKGQPEACLQDNHSQTDQEHHRHPHHKQVISGNRDIGTERDAEWRKKVRECLLIHPEENLAAVGEKQGDTD